MTILSAILTLISILPKVIELFEKYGAQMDEKKKEELKANLLSAIELSVSTGDQRPIENEVSTNPGQASGVGQVIEGKPQSWYPKDK